MPALPTQKRQILVFARQHKCLWRHHLLTVI